MPISPRAAALRLHVEASLAGRVVAPLEYRNRQPVETVSSGIAEIDALTGGLPRGCLTEIFGAACSGRTSLLLAALAARTAEHEVCALVDGRDAFAPSVALAAGVNLQQLLWVRCKNIDQALRATDLLIQGGGFGLIALDLSDVAPRIVRQVQLNVWFRFRRAVEDTPTIFFLLGQESNAKTCASLVLRMESETGAWRQTAQKNALTGAVTENTKHTEGNLLVNAKNWAEVVRSRMQSHSGAATGEDGRPRVSGAAANRVLSIDARRMDSKRMNAAEFETRTKWNYLADFTDGLTALSSATRDCVGGRAPR